MKHYNITIPSDFEELEYIENDYKPLERNYRGWKEHYHHEFWPRIKRKFNSYLGWNINDARSDFFNWCKKNYIPKIINGESWDKLFVKEFDLDDPVWRRCYGAYKIVDDIICKRDPTSWEIKQDRIRHYRNEGHQLIGYRINPRVKNCREVTNKIYSLFGKSKLDFINGDIVTEEYIIGMQNEEHFCYHPVENCVRLFNELHDKSWDWKKKKWIYGKYYDGKGYIGYLWEPVYTEDRWVKLTKKEKNKRIQEFAENNIKHYNSNKTARKEANKRIYDKAIEIAKGKAAESAAENLITIERMGFTKDSFKAFGGQPNLK